MELQKAIEILENYNKWRRDDEGDYIQQSPKEIGIAIDVVVDYFKNRK